MGKQSLKSKIGTRRESDILSSCLKYLKARGIFAMRNNIGAMKVGNRFVKFGTAGCSDILAITRRTAKDWIEHYPIWIECKRPGGVQSPAQKAFAETVRDYGMKYIIVRSADELSTYL